MARTPAFDAAYRKGIAARIAGKTENSCPYHDYRTHTGSVTFSRGFRRAWFAGYGDQYHKEKT